MSIRMLLAQLQALSTYQLQNPGGGRLAGPMMARKLSQNPILHDIQMNCQTAAHDKASPWLYVMPLLLNYKGDSDVPGEDRPDLCLYIGTHNALQCLTETFSS